MGMEGRKQHMFRKTVISYWKWGQRPEVGMELTC